MKTIIVDLNKKFPKLKNVKQIELVVLADIHIGDPLFNKKEFLKARDYIRDTENCFCILNGDLINNATKNSVSDIYCEELKPMEQINILLDYLEPIRDKIIAATSGNHELRSYKESGIDIMAIVMKQLGILDRYADEAYYIFLYFGDKYRGRTAPMCYTIYGTHGSGGGASSGAKMNKLIKLADTCYADLYVMNHLHQAMATELNFFLPDYGNQCVSLKIMKFLMSNSFLDFGGYGERAGYRPLNNNYKKATLSGTERNIRIEI